MKYSEELLWILDKPGTTLWNQDDWFRVNIEFVQSLGLKCDCVGWCKMDLSHPRTPEILNSISIFCKENGWRARCLYTRKFVELESDWYELVPTYFKDNTPCGRIETITKNNGKVYTRVIRAFNELSPTPKKWGEDIYVPERFRNFCIQNNLDDLDFCWAKDKGKYEAEQYFHVYGKQLVPQIAVGDDLKSTNVKLISAAGGWLPEIVNIFHELQQVNLQDCYLADDLPDSGIAYIYIPRTFSRIGRHAILLHKDIVQSLLKEKVLPLFALRPAAVVKSLPGGYSLKQTQVIERPTSQFMTMLFMECEKLKSTVRPIRMVSEKDALKILRLAKKERKEDFQKGLPKSKSGTLLHTDYSVLIPYYSVANGCFLSDEYEFLSSMNAMNENIKFQERISREDLLDIKPEGIVIGRCPNGDVILLCNDGKVIRFSHEGPVAVEQWPTLAQFFVDAINE